MRHPFSDEALSEWLRKQNPDQGYIWRKPNLCLLAQYANTLGLDYSDLPSRLLKRWERIVAQPKPHRFGAGLARLEGYSQTNPWRKFLARFFMVPVND